VPQGTLEALREAGVDLERLGVSTGASLTATQTDRLLECALRSVREPWFGLTLGASVRPRHQGIELDDDGAMTTTRRTFKTPEALRQLRKVSGPTAVRTASRRRRWPR